MEAVEILRTVLFVIIGTISIAVFGIVFGLIYKGIDRKISAHMQGRIGPPIRQPFRDVVKLFTKENIVPENSIPWIFNMAPFIGLISTISILLFLPIGGFNPILGGLLTNSSGEPLIFGDLILILYLLLIPSLALVIGGFASGSPYATVGAQREMATMIAYEFPLAIIIITIAWVASSFGDKVMPFSVATLSTSPVWSNVAINDFTITTIVAAIFVLVGFILLLLSLVLVTPAELSKIPFDSPEAETEIAGGLLTEYSGRNLGLFYLMDAVKTIVMASLIVAIFFPYNIYNIANLTGGELYLGAFVNIIFYLIKVLIVIIFSVTIIRVAIARLKIDQIVYTYWTWITLISLFGLVLIMFGKQLVA